VALIKGGSLSGFRGPERNGQTVSRAKESSSLEALGPGCIR